MQFSDISIPVQSALETLLQSEDLDDDKLITVDDEGPKVLDPTFKSTKQH